MAHSHDQPHSAERRPAAAAAVVRSSPATETGPYPHNALYVSWLSTKVGRQAASSHVWRSTGARRRPVIKVWIEAP